MLKLSEGMLLYHGSYCEVKTPALAKCADFKDFGKGFYLTSSKEQAENFINTSLRKAKAQGVIDENQEYGVISTFRYHHSEGIANYIFRGADAEWLHCVVGPVPAPQAGYSDDGYQDAKDGRDRADPETEKRTAGLQGDRPELPGGIPLSA